MHDMLHNIGTNWDWLYTMLKRGRCIIKEEALISVSNKYFNGIIGRDQWKIDEEIPIFTEKRSYINKRLEQL